MNEDKQLLAFGLTREEMACKCCGKVVATPELLQAWADFRAKLGRPVKIISGYRCPQHNAEVGGETHSRHTLGQALDIACDAVDLESGWVYRLLAASGFRGVGHGRGIFHIDVRETPYAWIYTSGGMKPDTELAKLLRNNQNGEKR